MSQALVFALIGSLAGCSRHQDVFEGLDVFEELLGWVHCLPSLSGMNAPLPDDVDAFTPVIEPVKVRSGILIWIFARRQSIVVREQR